MAKRAKVRYEDNIHFVIHGEVKRPWGHEVRVAIFDNDDNHVDSRCITWPKNHGKPEEVEITARVVEGINRYRDRRDNPPVEPTPEYFMERTDLEKFLVGRGYLEAGQHLNDLPDLRPATIEKPRWRKVWDYLNSPLWGG